MWKTIRWKIYTWFVFHYGVLLAKLFPNLSPFWKYWAYGIADISRSEPYQAVPRIKSKWKYDYQDICEDPYKHWVEAQRWVSRREV